MKILRPHTRFDILSTGRAWPKGPSVTNLDLLSRHSETRDKSPEILNELDMRIQRMFGFRERFFSAPTETSESLALEAVKKALCAQGEHGSPEAFVLGSTTSCRYTGSQATSVLGKLDLSIPAFEVKAGCSTSLASLNLVHALCSQGYEKVLVSCAETLSKVIHPGVRETAFGLADGAAALYFQKPENPSHGRYELLASVYSTDGKYVDLYTTPGILPPNRESLDEGLYYLKGDGAQLKTLAREKYLEMLSGLIPSQADRKKIRWIIPHQVNRPLIDEVYREADLSGEILWSADRYGNIGGASVLFTLAEALEDQRFQSGDQILLMSVGGGLSFAAQLWSVH